MIAEGKMYQKLNSIVNRRDSLTHLHSNPLFRYDCLITNMINANANEYLLFFRYKVHNS